MISFDVHKLIRQLLPTFLRTPIRIAWLEALLAPLTALWATYVLWRSERMYEAYTTCQTISMEAYLNRLFDPERQRIRIIDVSATAELVYVELRGEGYGLYIDGDEGAIVPLKEEQLGNTFDGFIVLIPAELDGKQRQITGVVDTIRAVGIGYEIQLYYADWLLTTGRWDDAGQWEDDAQWNDNN